MTTAIEILCTAAMQAAAVLVHERNIDITAEKLAADLRTTIKSNLPRIMTQWKEATEANVGEMWLRELVNAQSIEMAMIALGLKNTKRAIVS